MTDLLAVTVERSRIRTQILECERCPLHLGTTPVPFRGRAPSPIAFLGEAPGGTEEAQGKPFVGKSGKLFDQFLFSAGLGSSQDWFVMNTCCCRPPDNRAPTPEEIRACQPNLRAQLALCNPKWVVTLGNVGLRSLAVTTTPITAARGRPFEIPAGPARGRMCLAVYHPAAAVRENGKGSRSQELKQDLRLLRQLLDGTVDWRVVGARVAGGKLKAL